MSRRLLLLVAVMAIAVVAVPLAAARPAGTQLSLVAYSTPRDAYASLIPMFQKTPDGNGVSFTQSYGASGDQTRAIIAGLNADVVELSLAPDMDQLVQAGIVSPTWKQQSYRGIVTDSVVVFVVRPGNPKHIKTWNDLLGPGVQVVTPNPFTSGGARWNVMAAYGAESDKGADRAAGLAYLNQLFKNVPVQDDSARKSLQTFVGGKGDAMIAYENDAIFAQQNHQPIDYTIPASTILIENPVAVTSTSKHPQQAKAFVDFLYTQQAQEIFARNGYRPVVAGVADGQFPTPAGLFTIQDLGGWTDVAKTFFDPTTGLMVDVEKSIGVTVQAK